MPSSPNGETGCPSAETLDAFGRGDLQPQLLETIGAHLGGCGSCVARLNSLAGSPDTLVSGLRLLAAAGTSTPDPACDLLEAAAKSVLSEATAGTADGHGAVQIPGFTILGEIGRGRLGDVYRARPQGGGPLVALKRLPASLAADRTRLERFRAEAGLAAGLPDARCVPLIEVLESPDGLVLVTPFVDGSDLGRIIASRRTVRGGARHAGRYAWGGTSDADFLAFVLPVLDQLVEAVATLHRAGVAHGDVKSSNILVGADGRAWLTDVGLSRLKRPDLVGLSGEPGGEFRGDLGRLGAVLYETLTLARLCGEPQRPNTAAVPIPAGQLQPLLPSCFEGFFERAFTADLGKRHETADELRQHWRAARAGADSRPRARGMRAWLRRLLQSG